MEKPRSSHTPEAAIGCKNEKFCSFAQRELRANKASLSRGTVEEWIVVETGQEMQVVDKSQV